MANLDKFFTADGGGIKFLWKLVIKEIASLSSQLMAWATERFVQSINGKSGSSITIVKDDVGLGNVDNTADADKHVAYAATAGDADTLDGKHAADFMLKSEHEGYEDVISTSLNDLEARKVDKESGKGLSSNDYTNDEKQKLAGIEAGAQVNAPNTVVDANYVHTDNNYTTADKNKLSGIESGAQKNTVTSVAGKTGDVTIGIDDVGGLQDELDSKQDNLPFTSAPSENNKVVTQNELKSAVTGASNYLGTIEAASSLSTTAKKGDFYRVKTAWDGVHVGDMIIAEKDNPSALIDGVNWSLMHNEMDTDTTYTFEDGTDGFSVTPSVGDPKKVNVAVKKVNGHSIESDVPANAKFTDTIIDNVAGDGIDVSGEHGENISLDTDTKNAIADAKADHTKLGGHTIGKDVPANAVFTDEHTSKDGHYAPSEDAGSQLSKSASGGTDAWDFNVVTGVTIKRDVKGHVVGVDVASKKVPANPNTDYQATKAGHYIPSANEKTLSPDTSVLRDPARDMAFVGAIHEDDKGHVVAVDTVAILALTNAEIQAIIDQATAEMAAEMA